MRIGISLGAHNSKQAAIAQVALGYILDDAGNTLTDESGNKLQYN